MGRVALSDRATGPGGGWSIRKLSINRRRLAYSPISDASGQKQAEAGTDRRRRDESWMFRLLGWRRQPHGLIEASWIDNWQTRFPAFVFGQLTTRRPPGLWELGQAWLPLPSNAIALPNQNGPIGKRRIWQELTLPSNRKANGKVEGRRRDLCCE